jgi:hypothetical protein
MMLVAMLTVHLRNGFSSVNTIGLTAAGPQFGPPGYEVNLLYVAGLLALMSGGAGSWSVDARLARARGDRQHRRGDRARGVSSGLAMVAAVLLPTGVAGAGGPPSGPLEARPPDAVVAGTACVDKYEASVWRIPDPATTNRTLW